MMTCSFGLYAQRLLILVVSIATRFHRLSLPAHVVWDETHFGKMGSYYINQTFFFDVHPPLGKMLIGAAGVMSGYDGMFPFEKPGDAYGAVQYLGMRQMCAMHGSLIPILLHEISLLLTDSYNIGLVSASLAIADVGTLTISRYILLDPLLLFYILLSVYLYLKFDSSIVYSLSWWLWMSLTGCSLAASLSVKFVGLFTIFFIVVQILFKLWFLLSSDISLQGFFLRFFSQFFGFTSSLFLTYGLIFYCHLLVLKKSGDGDSFFSSRFRASLEGNNIYNISMPNLVAIGSQITIKNLRLSGGYLHSHVHVYPHHIEKASLQQVTTYAHRDENNVWLIQHDGTSENDSERIKLIKSDSLIRLFHAETGGNLHVLPVAAPITKRHYLVSAAQDEALNEDLFVVKIVNGESLNPLVTHFQLLHKQLGCVIQSGATVLPDWGWKQNEVTCSPNTRHPNSYWVIEIVEDKRLPLDSIRMSLPTMMEKFVESHMVMFDGNSGLHVQPGEESSRPWQWPLNYRGQVFSSGSNFIYLIGNPFVWMLCLACIAFFLCYILFPLPGETQLRHHYAMWFTFSGWIIHYVPFWYMRRVLYFHHYFPALQFSFVLSSLCLYQFFHLVSKYCWFSIEDASSAMLLSFLVWSFVYYSPLSYGFDVADEISCSKLRYLSSWEF